MSNECMNSLYFIFCIVVIIKQIYYILKLDKSLPRTFVLRVKCEKRTENQISILYTLSISLSLLYLNPFYRTPLTIDLFLAIQSISADTERICFFLP